MARLQQLEVVEKFRTKIFLRRKWGRLSMEKRRQTTTGAEEVNASDEEVWSAIRYLDDEHNDAVSVVLVVACRHGCLLYENE